MNILSKISNIVNLYIRQNFFDENKESVILESMDILLGERIDNYTFDICSIGNESVVDLVPALAKINEKSNKRKCGGVYYTDSDVTDFIMANAFLHFIKPTEKKVWDYETALKKLKHISIQEKIKIIEASSFDPTCGTGEFLLSSFRIKSIINETIGMSFEKMLGSVYGNDIDYVSVDISKLRLFFSAIQKNMPDEDIMKLASIINKNFIGKDAVAYDGVSFGKKDIIVGNPPYVEYGKYEGQSLYCYGNVYADVLHNAVKMLGEDGVMSFVVPLSYVSTIRMGKIRKLISSHANKQIVINFADRPDSLFSAAHQKLTILLAQKGNINNIVLSSSYKYWYNSERERLFHAIPLENTLIDNEMYWPKIGNKIESSIFKKFKNLEEPNWLTIDALKGETDCIYINTRGCFWMKVFSKNPHSNSYIPFFLPLEKIPFIYCLINSSLFFLLWVIISDGWHVTSKELSFIKIPSLIKNQNIWVDLKTKLETKLEETKKYVGTKQVEYEYKHKECKYIIDEIDDELARVYNLSQCQLKYIKEYSLKYRMGDGI